MPVAILQLLILRFKYFMIIFYDYNRWLYHCGIPSSLPFSLSTGESLYNGGNGYRLTMISTGQQFTVIISFSFDLGCN